MNFLRSLLITVGPRLIASALGGIATYIGVKTSGAVQIDPAHAAEIVTGILVTYSASHKGLSAKINPGDSATARVADAIKDAADTGTTVKVDSK